MLRAQHLEMAVEIAVVASAHIDGTDAKPLSAIVQHVPVDQAVERLLQLRGIIEARRAHSTRKLEPGIDLIGREEAGQARHHRQHRTRLVAHLAEHLAFQREMPDLAMGDRLPEITQPVEPVTTRIPGDDRGVNRTDRDAGKPLRLARAFGWIASLIGFSIVALAKGIFT
ncbi:hypothetical protein GGD50_005214 [Rhizobium paranaense]|uniref:Uncharacterized protein n=1 Tax=Rhizobium paranaense TaxID=1650438 RepID=A0A7W8XVW7_9HYPH|nr:hypothetical protein [Rhizobium paranaense]